MSGLTWGSWRLVLTICPQLILESGRGPDVSLQSGPPSSVVATALDCTTNVVVLRFALQRSPFSSKSNLFRGMLLESCSRVYLKTAVLCTRSVRLLRAPRGHEVVPCQVGYFDSSLDLDGDSVLLVLISSDPWVVLGMQPGSLLGEGSRLKTGVCVETGLISCHPDLSDLVAYTLCPRDRDAGSRPFGA